VEVVENIRSLSFLLMAIGLGNLQQIAVKRVYVQNAKTLPRLDLLTSFCGEFDRKLL